ncbi:MAG: ATP-grasp domain-containing protein [Elusimicrobia bacterium]|nr:ATP-grasp domain-containing protein [Elusimicrobiota bacterium]
MKRPLASALAFLIVALSPGAPAYQAFAQTVGKTGSAAGATGDAATSVNSGVNSGGLAAPLALPVQNLGLNSALAPAAVPALNAAAIPALTPSVAAVSPVASLSQPGVFKAAPAKPLVPTALQPAARTANAPVGLSAASKQVETLSQSAKPVLEGVKNGDATAALNVVFENGSQRGPLGAVTAPSGPAALRSGLKRSAPSAAPQGPAEVPSAQAPAAKPSVWQSIRSTFDLSEFNKSEKSYIAGQAVFLLAISVYLASLPLLVSALTGDAAMTGVARMVHYWVFGGASLFAGAVVSKTPMKRILVGAAGGRALLFGSIGALALFGGLPWAAFLVLVGVNSLIVAHNHLVDIDTGGAAKIFKGTDQKSTDHKIEKAGYVYDFIYYGMMLVVPALIGLPMDWIDARFGAGIGAGAGFAVFAALMGVVSYIYAKRVVTVGDLASAPWAGLKDYLGRLAGALRTFGRILLDIPRRNWATAKIIMGNKAILARSTMATMENFVEDALFAVVLPTFAIDILKVGAFGNGLLLSAITAGGLVASMFLMKRIQALQQKHGTYKVLAGLTAVAALAFVPSIGLWLVPSLALAIPAVFMMKLMLQPLRSRMRALLQTEIKNDPKAAPHADDIYSLMTFVEVIAAGAGGLAFAWLFHHSMPGSALALALGALAPMKIITVTLFAMGFVYLGGLRWVKAQLSKPTRTVHKSPEGNEAKMLAQLSVSLTENGLPGYKTAKVPGPSNDDAPTVAILTPASRHKVAIAREGGRQSPGDVNLVLDASWLIQERYPDGRTKILVTKGVVFDEKGQASVVEYETPRRVHYFANFMTLGANDRDDGVIYEENLDVPQSNSLQREDVINDKLGTRIVMAAKGVSVPATLAFLLSAHPLAAAALNGSFSAPSVSVQALPEGDDADARVAASVDAYLARLEGDEIVVKPSGTQFHSGIGVKFFKKTERDAILEHVKALRAINGMTAEGAILLDSRVNSAPLERGGRKMETTLRVLVSRAPWDGGVAAAIYARVGPWGKPTTAEAADPRDKATVEPWEVLLKEWRAAGYLDAASSRELDEEVKAMGPAILAALTEYERTLPRAAGEGYQVQTDMIGLDVMIERRGNKLVPVVIEINDHNSGGQFNLDKMYPNDIGAHSRPYVATMLQRARRDALKGKRIVIVGAGYEGKKPIFERARELGVDIILVDSAKSWANDPRYISELIPTDNTKPAEALTIARKKLQRSIRKNGKLDGITTFWEDDVVLTADVAKALGLPYHSPDASRTARSKFETQAVLAAKGVPAARQQTLQNLSTAANDKEREAMVAAFRESASKVGFPAVIKPVSGAAAMGTEKVSSLEEAVAAYKRISAMINPKTDPIFSNNSDLLLMQYLDGPEYDVDLVMVAGKPVFQSVTDNKPTREPSFLATGSRLPSTLTAKQQKESAEQAIASAQALGLTDGVIHMEGKYTSEGARLIEANARMGGTYVMDWIKGVWGVDLSEEGLMAAARIPGKPYMPSQPIVHLDGDFVNSDKAGVIKVLELPEEARRMPGFVRFRMVKKAGDRITTDEGGGYARVAMLEVGGKDAAEAKRNLEAIKAKIRFVVE